MPKGVTSRRPKTRAALLDAALEVFALRSFHGATIGEICERAGLTTGAFYSNFSSKDGLFLALFENHSQLVVQRFSEIVDNALLGEDPFATMLSAVGEWDDNDRNWYLVTTEYTLHAIRNPEKAKVLAEYDRQLRAELTQLLALLLDKSDHSSSVDLDMLARLVIAIHEGGLLQSLVEPDALPRGELGRRYFPTVIRAIVAGL